MLKISLDNICSQLDDMSGGKNPCAHAACWRARAEAEFVVLPSASETFRVSTGSTAAVCMSPPIPSIYRLLPLPNEGNVIFWLCPNAADTLSRMSAPSGLRFHSLKSASAACAVYRCPPSGSPLRWAPGVTRPLRWRWPEQNRRVLVEPRAALWRHSNVYSNVWMFQRT